MRTPAISLLLLIIHAVHGQLNYEGNPLTEDTVYTAEESQFADNTAKARALRRPEIEDSYLLAAKILKAERSQNLYPNNGDGVKNGARSPLRNDLSYTEISSANSYKTLPNDVLQNSPVPANDAAYNTQTTETQYYKATEAQDQVYPINAEPQIPQISNPSDSALAMFLNSKTPQESKMALEEYLSGGQGIAQTTNESPSPYQPHISDIVLPQQQAVVENQQLDQIVQQDARQLQYGDVEYPSPQSVQYFVANQQAGRKVNFVGRKGPLVIHGPPSSFGRRSYAVRPPYKTAIYRAQPRIGPVPGYRKGYGPGGDGLEVIYTKPPGHIKSQYFRGQNPHEDAGAWFPDANHPPPDLDVYYSQLYSQSYDPHYYNYIAKYGKIKPHLYGKFEKKDHGFFAELFASFKKHGMKHVMHPMFLLGMGIPMITLMLSALVSHRSFARSSSGADSDMRITEEDIDEWTTKLRRALDCYTESTSESERSKCAVWD